MQGRYVPPSERAQDEPPGADFGVGERFAVRFVQYLALLVYRTGYRAAAGRVGLGRVRNLAG